jgi:hypothetical protein
MMRTPWTERYWWLLAFGTIPALLALTWLVTR